MKVAHVTMIKKNAARSWKVVFPILALFLCLSCNKDDDEEPAPTIPTVTSFLNVTIDGTQYNFNHFEVNEVTVIEPDYTYVDVQVIATIVGDDTRQIEFSLEKDVTGPNTVYFFYLYNTDKEFEVELPNASFNANVSINANKRIIGTLSGTITNADSETTTITNGSFDITYQTL